MKKLLLYLPFSYMWILRRVADDPETVLDLGCGDGGLMTVISKKNWDITGVDIHKRSLEKAKRSGVYKNSIKGNLVEVCKSLLKKGKKYDLVFCSQVIEHLPRQEGEKLLDLAEKLAKKRVYFGTPRGFMNQPEEFIEDSPYQYHKSGWSEEDFRERGYKVYGVGFLPIWSEKGLARGKSKLLTLISSVISYVMSPITFYIPSLGAGIIAVKVKPM